MASNTLARPDLRAAGKTFVYRLLPPLWMWWFARILVTYRARQGLLTLAPSSWVRWDSFKYLEIAQHGYSLHRCGANEGLFVSQAWCGNAAWFPGYPLLLRAAEWFGAPVGQAGALLSALLFLAALVLLWNGFLLELGWVRGLLVLGIAAAFPGVVYAFAVFPMSLLALSLVATIWAARAERYGLMAFSAGVGVFAYPNAVVVIPVVAAFLFALPASSVEMRLRRTTLAVVAVAPLLIIAVWHASSVGHWNAFLLEQGNSVHGITSPLLAIWTVVVRQDATIQRLPGNADLAGWVANQTALVAVMVVAAIATAALGRRYRRFRLDRYEVLALAMAIALWLLPLLTSVTGLYRREFAVFPVLIVLRRLPWPYLLALFLACLIVTYHVSGFFFIPTGTRGGLI